MSCNTTLLDLSMCSPNECRVSCSVVIELALSTIGALWAFTVSVVITVGLEQTCSAYYDTFPDIDSSSPYETSYFFCLFSLHSTFDADVVHSFIGTKMTI